MKRRNFIKLGAGTSVLYSLPIVAASAAGGVEYAAEKKLADGQPLLKIKNGSKVDFAWTKKKITTLHSLKDYQPDETPQISAFGGDLSKNFGKSGFFRTEMKNERWWMVDPEGHPFLSAGFNSVKVAGNEEQVMDILRETGVTELGCWSHYEKLRKVNNPLPYSVSMGFIDNFKDSQPKKESHGRGWKRRYPNLTIPVFHPEFEGFADNYAREKLKETKDDPYCIGYFSDNELPFLFDALERYLELPEEDYGHQAAKKWFKDEKGKTHRAEITHQDRMDFLGYVADTYYSICSKCIRKYAPNHLYLGSRLHGHDISLLKSTTSQPVFKAAGKYVDVVSINLYGTTGLSVAEVNRFTDWTGKPIQITEFYAKGMDSGLQNNDGAGAIVPTQADRGLYYQNYVLSLLQSNGCVGWSWHRFIDPEGDDTNKGLVNKDYEPYTDFQEKVKELNNQRYSLANHFNKSSLHYSIAKPGNSYVLYRNSAPFFLKGQIGLKDLDRLIDATGNAIKIYGDYAYNLNYAGKKDIAVLFNVDFRDYISAIQKSVLVAAVAENDILNSIKKHMDTNAVFAWGLGDNAELELSEDERITLWKSLNGLANKIKKLNPNHLVITSISANSLQLLPDIARLAPELDAVGINAFNQELFEQIPANIAKYGWEKPFIVTDFNYGSDCDILNAPFDVPYWIEGDKMTALEKDFQNVVVKHPQCLGAFMLT